MNDVNVFKEALYEMHDFTHSYIKNMLMFSVANREKVTDLGLFLSRLALETSPSQYFSLEERDDLKNLLNNDVFTRTFAEKLAAVLELKYLSHGLFASDLIAKFTNSFYAKRPAEEEDAVFPGHFVIMNDDSRDRSRLWYFALYFLISTWYISAVPSLFENSADVPTSGEASPNNTK